MARQGRKGLSAAAAASSAVLAGLLLFSCAGAPPARLAEDDPFGALGSGGRVYAAADARALREGGSLRPLLEAAAAGTDAVERLSGAMGRTEGAALAWFGDIPPRFRVRAVGYYPRFARALSLTLSGDWKRVGGEAPYWRGPGGVALAFLEDGSALVSDGAPRADSLGPEPDASFRRLSGDAPLRLWMPDPRSAVSGLLGPAAEAVRLPISSLALSLAPSEADPGAYRLELALRSTGENEARALAALLRLARNFVPSDDPDPLRSLLGRALRAEYALSGDVLSCVVDRVAAAALVPLASPLFGTLLAP